MTSPVHLHSDSDNSLAQTIIEMERSALDRWGKGDPSGFLEISDEHVVYFDPFQDRRLNGWTELQQLYESLRGTISADRFEFIDPLVQATDSMAVLTFNLLSYSGKKEYRWNCTEVYRLNVEGQWRIIQTHWSLTKPQLILD